jgi:hypothetical protein
VCSSHAAALSTRFMPSGNSQLLLTPERFHNEATRIDRKFYQSMTTSSRDSRRPRTTRRSRYGCRNCKLRKLKVSDNLGLGTPAIGSTNLPSAMKRNHSAKSALCLGSNATLCSMSLICSPPSMARRGHRSSEKEQSFNLPPAVLSGRLTLPQPIN